MTLLDFSYPSYHCKVIATTLQFYQNKYALSSLDFPVSTKWGDETLTIPLFPGMTDSEQNHVIEVLLTQVEPLIGR